MLPSFKSDPTSKAWVKEDLPESTFNQTRCDSSALKSRDDDPYNNSMHRTSRQLHKNFEPMFQIPFHSKQRKKNMIKKLQIKIDME